VSELAWSPDGRWIVFAATVDNERDKKLAAEGKRKRQDSDNRGPSGDSENREPGSGSGGEFAAPVRAAGEWEEDDDDEKDPEDKGDHVWEIERVHFKADGAGLTLRRTHLFIVPSKGGTPRQLTEGDWDAMAPRWSPDGKSLAFVANQEADAEYTSTRDVFVMSMNSDGRAGAARRATNHDATIERLDWLPDGSGFVVFAHRRLTEGAYATNPEVWTVALDGRTRNLTPGFDRPASQMISGDLRTGSGEGRPRFSPDGSTVYFMVTDQGCVHVYSVPVAGGDVRRVIGGEREVLNFVVVEDGGIVFNATTPTLPNDIFKVDSSGGNERRLTSVNADVEPTLRLSEPRSFWIERPDGGRVQGWIVLPPDYREGEKYPLVLQIHGGPHMSYGNVYFHEFQATAARGYIVLYTNPRGSQGYGQKFSDAILNDWGGVDYDDIMACLDYAIAQGNVDERRLGVAGGSYGGYMVTWVIGHTDRFKAAVASRMVSNLYSAWGSGDFTWMLWNWEFEGTPQERTALYLERSPISYVEKIRTPLLITHAEDDLRTNIEQGDQMYTALKVLKREVKMVRFPSGGHDISRTGKPSLRVERMEALVGWFDSKLGRSDE
jgi:dipeptidyl aminopeptidase/acylaminoacyl peptidase